MSLHNDSLCKNQQMCVGDSSKEEKEEKGEATLKTQPKEMELLSQPGGNILILFFPS